MVFLLVWIPDQNLLPVFFVISALWGICDAIWQTQCNSEYNYNNPEMSGKFTHGSETLLLNSNTKKAHLVTPSVHN